ncbi:hypothetical protein [Pseudogemmobacter faecipullorum]|uniref:Uncharacterized protein n=1 Tax=Pseudogemmobacter faecipullorum TaxID=2755041 RepID=A0ABS8CNU1_9RHOB|nr:hypothetical protein [Pseudogemmobacter faecipullorum]MCB5410865.1 hypothetical protein [Pseudogemmobacter faecipullorum]
MAGADTSSSSAAGAEEPGKVKRVVVVLRPQDLPKSRRFRRQQLLRLGAALILLAGLVLGYRAAAVFSPPEGIRAESGKLTERVRGGLYALELATPRGQARWMLEFDAEIVTSDGPDNPAELRNALEDLVITASSLPLVQASDTPEVSMREAMLAIAAQAYPWLVDIYLTRSDIRKDTDRLGGIGRAMRDLYGD